MKNLLILSIALLFASCDLPEGEGGDSIIRGYVYLKNYNSDFSNIIQEYYVGKEDVFIIYGSDTTSYHDKTETHFDGSFEFRNLREGNYTVYAYSKDTSKYNGLPLIPIMRSVEINSNSETVEVDEIVIID